MVGGSPEEIDRLGQPLDPPLSDQLSSRLAPSRLAPSRLAPSRLAPEEAALCVLRSDRASDRDLAQYRQVLDAQELAAAARFHFAHDCRDYVCAHALVRCLLAVFGAGRAADLSFVRDRYGKPEMESSAGRPGLRFNLSHTTGLVACAVTRARDIGIDVERTERAVEAADLAARFFAPEEAALLHGRRAAALRDRFFTIWTLKEAFIKAVGGGLSIPLDSFAFRLNPVEIAFTQGADNERRANADATDRGKPGDWRFLSLPPGPGYALAAAVRSGAAGLVRYRYWQMSCEDLAAMCAHSLTSE